MCRGSATISVRPAPGGALHLAADDGVGFGGVGPDDEEGVVELDLAEGVGHRGASERCGQTGHSGSVSGSCAVVQVVGAHHHPDELLHQPVVFVGAAGRAEGAEGVRSITVPYLAGSGAATRSRASSQVAFSSTPFLRMSGVVSRSGLWIMSVWNRPLTQRALPLTGASGAVVTPTTLPSLTFRSKLQPVPQSGQVVRTRLDLPLVGALELGVDQSARGADIEALAAGDAAGIPVGSALERWVLGFIDLVDAVLLDLVADADAAVALDAALAVELKDGRPVEQLELPLVTLEFRGAGAVADGQALQLAGRGLVAGALQAAGGFPPGRRLVEVQLHLVEVARGPRPGARGCGCVCRRREAWRRYRRTSAGAARGACRARRRPPSGLCPRRRRRWRRRPGAPQRWLPPPSPGPVSQSPPAKTPSRLVSRVRLSAAMVPQEVKVQSTRGRGRRLPGRSPGSPCRLGR